MLFKISIPDSFILSRFQDDYDLDWVVQEIPDDKPVVHITQSPRVDMIMDSKPKRFNAMFIKLYSMVLEK